MTTSTAMQPGARGRSLRRVEVAAIAFAAAAMVLAAGAAHAVGTPAGTDITNRATANYTVGSTPLTEQSNDEILTVAELVDVDVTLQTAGNVTVTPGATGQLLTFRVSNIGNGTDSYTLAGLSTLSGDDFDPTLVDVILDDGDNVYEPGTDPQYVVGSNDPVLAADSQITIFVLNDIPLGLLDGALGDSQLTATSNTGTGPAGTVITNGGDGGTIDAVIGTNEGDDAATGRYIAASILVTLTKTSTVSDPITVAGTEPIPGATITYSILVRVTGSGTASGVVVRDPIPPNTTYVPNSMTLNAAGLSDPADSPADEADFNVTNSGEITVGLGDLTGSTPDQTITFDVTID